MEVGNGRDDPKVTKSAKQIEDEDQISDVSLTIRAEGTGNDDAGEDTEDDSKDLAEQVVPDIPAVSHPIGRARFAPLMD